MSTFQAMQAQQLHEPELLDKPNVVGVAVGYKESNGVKTDEVAVVVLVEEKKPLAALTAETVIPRELDGMRTDVIEVGYLRAQQVSPRGRFRPLMPGISIGHYKITAGTFGAVVTDKNTGERFILSNNHVLANSNDSLIGDAILQPGTADAGVNPGDLVATLERFVKLRYTDEAVTPEPPPTPGPGPTPPPGGGSTSCDIVAVTVSILNAVASLLGSQQRVTSTTVQAVSATSTASIPAAAVPENRMDCALARPVSGIVLSDEIRQIGKVSGTKPVSLGMRVRKYGRTTEYTEGTITLLNATVNIAYSTALGQKTARFVGQTITEAMSQGGDSGSLIVDATENKAVGLLFAGSNLATIFTPIDSILSELNINI